MDSQQWDKVNLFTKYVAKAQASTEAVAFGVVTATATTAVKSVGAQA